MTKELSDESIEHLKKFDIDSIGKGAFKTYIR